MLITSFLGLVMKLKNGPELVQQVFIDSSLSMSLSLLPLLLQEPGGQESQADPSSALARERGGEALMNLLNQLTYIMATTDFPAWDLEDQELWEITWIFERPKVDPRERMGRAMEQMILEN